jgi:transcriptional regulator with XRE-family HTH domain
LSTAAGLESEMGVCYAKRMGDIPFGERLRAIRKGEIVREGPEIGVRELGRLSGVDHATISQAENLKTWVGKLPSLEDLEGLAEGLGVALPDLIGRPIRAMPERASSRGPQQRSELRALRVVFAGLSARPAAAQLDELRMGRAETFAEMVPHLVDALEANVVLALRIAGVGASNSPTGKGRAKRKG